MKFLFEQSGYVLGRSLSRKRSAGRELSALIDQALFSRDTLNKKTQQYLMSNHDIRLTVSHLKHAILQSSLKYEDILKFTGLRIIPCLEH